MQVSCPNNVKIYNLSAGKSLPEWLSERKRRSLLKKNPDIRRRIELIQDFDMPAISNSIRASNDGQYILATGIYKPRVKCFDVNNLSLKFERCFDAEVVTFEILSDDYSKLIFLQCDRNIEIHAAYGKYHKLRIPRYGRDLKYHYPTCDAFIVGDSNEIYRLNLERGQFLQSLESESSSINKCSINPVHNLLVVGTQDGKIEAWDPRVRNKVETLDIALHCLTQNNTTQNVASISCLNFQGALTLGTGTTTGHILLYDIRSNKPFYVKNDMNELPITNIEFHEKMDLIYSMDSTVVKIWEKNTGKLYTSIESESLFNDLCIVKNTGMLFTANESPKMQTYYIPSLGPAPYWCSFLDNLTEELEESNYETLYDDYKFVTEEELEDLDLLHLIGTDLLKAHMHGYFMDMRLYRKAKDLLKPFEYEQYKKKRIQQKIEESRGSRVEVRKLPSVNKELAMKLIDDEETTNIKKKKKKVSSNLLTDSRFKALFTNPDFEVDKTTEEYNLLNPVISQLDRNKVKKLKAKYEAMEVDETNQIQNNDNNDENGSSDESFIHDSSSSDDEKPWVKEVRKQYRKTKRIKLEEERNEEVEKKISDNTAIKEPHLYEFNNGVEFRQAKPIAKKQERLTLGERLQLEEGLNVKTFGSGGNREMTFVPGKKMFNNDKSSEKKHRRDTNQLRSAKYLRKSKR